MPAAITDAYATAQEYKARVGKQSGADDDLIEEQLLMATRYFQGRLGVYFTKDAAATARVYYGDGSRRLRLGQAIASSAGLAVKVDRDNDGDFADETAITMNTDFQLRPVDADLGPVPAPWTELYIPDWAPTYSAWTNGHRVQVTALHGWPAVPEPIRDLVCEWVAVWRGESIRTTGRVNELDQVVETSPYHLSMLKRIEQLYHPTGGLAIG